MMSQPAEQVDVSARPDTSPCSATTGACHSETYVQTDATSACDRHMEAASPPTSAGECSTEAASPPTSVSSQPIAAGSPSVEDASPQTSDTGHRISADSPSVEAACSHTSVSSQQTEAASPPVDDIRAQIYVEAKPVYEWLFEKSVVIRTNSGRKSVVSKKTTRLLKSFVAWRTLLNAEVSGAVLKRSVDSTENQMGFEFATEGDDQQHTGRMDGGMEPLVSGNVRG